MKVRASGLGHCARRVGYRVIEEEDNQTVYSSEKPFRNPRFHDGHYHEYDVKERLGLMGVRFHSGITSQRKMIVSMRVGWVLGSAHIDGEIVVPEGIKGNGSSNNIPPQIKPGAYVLEVKSASSGPYWKFKKKGLREGFPEYFDQVQTYLNGTSGGLSVVDDNPVRDLYRRIKKYEVTIADWSFPTKALVVFKNKESGELAFEVVEKDHGYWEGLRKRWVVAEAYMTLYELPDRLYENSDNYECGDCPWKNVCWEDEDEEEGIGKEVVVGSIVPIAPDTDGPLPEEINTAADMYAVGKKIEGIGRVMMVESAPVLTAVQEGTAKVGAVRVTGFQANKTSWDYKELERVLNEDQLKAVKKTTTFLSTRRTVGEVDGDTIRRVFDMVKIVPGYKLLLEGIDDSTTQ